MNPQISRDSYDPEKRYSGVYQQQGRMLTDADWNELVDIIKARVDQAVAAIVGNGSPRSDGGKAKGILGDDAHGNYWLEYGEVYVDGIRAVIAPGNGNPDDFNFNNQADLPLSKIVTPSGNLYLDVWERSVSSLEDIGMRDKGLPSGADTCTRTQTMAQVKYYSNENFLTTNPAVGNALFTLNRATQVTSVNQLENFLFRLEVHDFEIKGATSELTLKWSTENGAEQCCCGEEQPGFKETKWVYELFSTMSEKHRGIFPAGGPKQVKGQLAAFNNDTYTPFAQSGTDTYEFVRRWNGYCVLQKNGDDEWQISSGCHGGTKLEASASGTNVKVENGVLIVTMNDLNLQFELTIGENGSTRFQKVFVPGDYWNGVVRKGVVVTKEQTAPAGIVHHYLKLGICESKNGKLFLSGIDEDTVRRLSFPTLSSLTADKVGITPEAGTTNQFTNVQDALNKKVNVDGDVRMKGPFEMAGPLTIGTLVEASGGTGGGRPAGETGVPDSSGGGGGRQPGETTIPDSSGGGGGGRTGGIVPDSGGGNTGGNGGRRDSGIASQMEDPLLIVHGDVQINQKVGIGCEVASDAKLVVTPGSGEKAAKFNGDVEVSALKINTPILPGGQIERAQIVLTPVKSSPDNKEIGGIWVENHNGEYQIWFYNGKKMVLLSDWSMSLNKKVDVDGDVRMKGPFEMEGPLRVNLNVGIGCEAGSDAKLVVTPGSGEMAAKFNGEIIINDGSAEIGKVLISKDNNGSATWKDLREVEGVNNSSVLIWLGI